MSWLKSLEQRLEYMTTHLSPSIMYPEARKSLQLEQFRCGDFSSMQRELESVFQHPDGIRLQYLPLAQSIANDLSGHRAIREWSNAPASTLVEIEALYAELDFFLAEAERAGALQQSYIIGVFPDDAANPTRPEPMLFLPHQVVSIKFPNPFIAAKGDISRASYVELLVPLQSPDSRNEWKTQALWYARLVCTPQEVWLHYPDGNREGVLSPDGSNPLGRVPLVGTRRVKPPENHTWLPPHAEDVRTVQIGVILAFSDIENTARECSVPAAFLVGENSKVIAQDMKSRAVGRLGLLPEGTTIEVANLQPAIAQYIQAVETTLYYLQMFRKTRPEAFQGSIVTGAARQADAEGFWEAREREESRLKLLENQLLPLMVAVANLRPRALPLEIPTLSLTYRYTRTPQNALQEAQSLAVLTELGLRDIVAEVAKTEGVSMARAESLIADRLKRKRDLFGQKAEGAPTPGLDKLDNAVPSPEGG